MSIINAAIFTPLLHEAYSITPPVCKRFPDAVRSANPILASRTWPRFTSHPISLTRPPGQRSHPRPTRSGGDTCTTRQQSGADFFFEGRTLRDLRAAQAALGFGGQTDHDIIFFSMFAWVTDGALNRESLGWILANFGGDGCLSQNDHGDVCARGRVVKDFDGDKPG